MVIGQYGVYWVNLDPTVGAEIKKTRPCVVISPDELNAYLDTVIIAPMTSHIHGYPYRVRTTVHGKEGEIVTDQIRTVDKRRLSHFICKLPVDTITKLRNVLFQMFG